MSKKKKEEQPKKSAGTKEEIITEEKEKIEEEKTEDNKVEEKTKDEKIEEEPAEVNPPQENIQTTTVVQTTPPKKNYTGLIIGIVCGVVAIPIVLLLVILLLINVFYLKRETKKSTIKVPEVAQKSEYQISGNELEDFDLYFLQLENKEENKIYSPLSIKYALAMLNEGTDGETHNQISSVIGDYKAKKYTNSDHMSFANAMFIRNSFKNSVKSDYVEKLSKNYGAEIIFDDFKSASTMNDWVSNKTFKLIDKLLEDDVVKNGDFFLINALAIDMNWVTRIQCATAPLPEGMTQNYYSVHYPHEKYSDWISPIEDEQYPSMKFNETDNIKSVELGASFNHYDIINDLGEENIRKTVEAKYKEFIEQNGGGEPCGPVNEYVDGYIKAIGSNYKSEAASTDFSIYDDDELKVFAKDLQTYDGTTLQYVAIMPKEAKLNEYVKELDAKSLNTTLEKIKEVKYENFKEGVITQVKGNIPLFKFDYKLDLLEDLKTLGIKDVFDSEKADLSKMVTGKQYIYDATHKANIEFSNDGIKAAAATSMGGAGSSNCGFDYLYDVPIEVIDITFDKPYLFLIRDKETHEVWFTGTVYSPTSNKA